MQTHAHDTKHDQGTAGQFAEAVTPAVERTANRLVEATQALAHAAGNGLDALSDRRQAALGACRDAVVANPLRAVGATLLAGLALGLLMRKW